MEKEIERSLRMYDNTWIVEALGYDKAHFVYNGKVLCGRIVANTRPSYGRICCQTCVKILNKITKSKEEYAK